MFSWISSKSRAFVGLNLSEMNSLSDCFCARLPSAALLLSSQLLLAALVDSKSKRKTEGGDKEMIKS
jgi:hypothetical protein